MPERRARVDRDAVNGQSRGVRPFELQDRGCALLDLLGELLIRRAEVREGRAAGVVGGRGRRWALVEIARAREPLGGKLRAHHAAIHGDQAAVRLVPEGDLAEGRHDGRVAEAEDQGEHDDCEH